MKQQIPAPVANKTNMNMNDFSKKEFTSLIEQAKSIAIIPSKIAGSDSYSAAVGLYYMLKEKYDSNSKEIKLIYTGKVPEESEDILNPEELATNLSERDLLVSIDFSNTNATHVNYTTDNNVLTFRLGPIPKEFNKDRIRTKITGFDFDLVITLGAQELADLGPIYNNLRHEINDSKKINLDNTNRNSRYGVLNIIDPTVDSLSMLVFKNATSWDMTPNKKAAKALLTGMTYRD